jgi:hypothetical protein
MAEWYNWLMAVEACRQKHIGPPPRHQQRIAYDQAHRWPESRAAPPTAARWLHHLWLWCRRHLPRAAQRASTTTGRPRKRP